MVGYRGFKIEQRKDGHAGAGRSRGRAGLEGGGAKEQPACVRSGAPEQ